MRATQFLTIKIDIKKIILQHIHKHYIINIV